MDIRNFFGGKGASTSKPVEKKRSEKISEVTLSDLTDGEDPMPRSMRKETAKNKRKKAKTDSEDEIPTPKKVVPKKSRVVLESDSDSSPERVAKLPPKRVQSSDESSADDIEIVSDKKKNVKGQKKKKVDESQSKLTFAKKSLEKKKEEPKKRKEPEEALINPADFFTMSSPAVKKTKKETTPIKDEKKKKPETPKKKENPVKEVEKKITPTKIEKIKEKEPTPKKISPSQKENAKKSPKKEAIRDEFEDSDEDFLSSAPVKPKKKEKSPLKEVKKPKKEAEKKPVDVIKKVEKIEKPPPSTPSSTSEISTADLPWVDKYKPKSMMQLVGQHGDKSPMTKLMGWLEKWAETNLGEAGKIKRPKPAPWAAGSNGTPFKAALLSGSPGVGKTTCAYMACQLLGLKMVEMNASDVRNKKQLDAHVGQLSGSHQIDQFFGKKALPQDNFKVNHVLIMDEVDGMSGNQDRAGISELIQIIKESKIPIICICNDRQHQKMRTLVNYCFDIRFPKPKVENIRSRMLSIAAAEKMKISKDELDEIIELSGCDVRQTIYNLQMRSKTQTPGTVNKKDVSVGPFEAARKLLDPKSTLREKNEMFFVDYGIMPLFIQENYLNLKNEKQTPLQAIRGVRLAANCISLGDNIDKMIRSSSAWKLLNEQSMLSCALPTMAIGGNMRGMLQFPSWLGKNSTAAKRQRLLAQLHMHTHLRVSSSLRSFATDYAPTLRSRVTMPLLKKESGGIPEVVEIMKEYDLIKDDTEALSELVVWPGKIDPGSKILSKVKAALTRALNKEHRMLPYSLDDVSKGRKKSGNIVGFTMDDEGNVVEEDEEDTDGEENEQSSEVLVKPATKGKAAAPKGKAKAKPKGKK